MAFQLLVLGWFAVAAFSHVANGTAFDATAIAPDWFNPFAVESFSAFAAGVSLSIFIYWGWDVTLTMNEETKNPEKTPGRAATVDRPGHRGHLHDRRTGHPGLRRRRAPRASGAGNPDNQGSIFAVLAGPVMGPFAILMSLAILSSSAASLQSTFVSPARTLLSMGHYKALPHKFGKISPSYKSPSYATDRLGRGGRRVLRRHPDPVRERAVGHHHRAGHDDLLLLRHHRPGLRLVLPRRGLQRAQRVLLQVPRTRCWAASSCW